MKMIKNYKFNPSGNLEKKALFLEETLENMQNHSNNLYKTIKRFNKEGKNTFHLRKKLKDLNTGIEEVHEKCNTIWQDIKGETLG